MPGFSPHDHKMMRRALALAARGLGRTSPNPVVGAVVSDRRGHVLATGWHRRAGTDHGEVAALRKLGFRAPGATLYVTLEPCNHHGRTPPCTEAILRAGVARIVVAMRDPHPLVDGRGLRRLRAAGVRVEVGLLADQARRLNAPFLTRLERGRPLVTLKLAETLDGRLATRTGDSRWVTGPAARALVHRLRDQHDAVLVGAGTVLADDPRLTARGRPGARDPLRVILDGKLRTPPRARCLPALILCAQGAQPTRAARLERAGATLLRLPGRDGRISIPRALAALAAHGVQSLLCEGGGETGAALLEAGCVDRMVIFIAPKIIGGRDAVPAVGGRGVARLHDAITVEDARLQWVGQDAMICGDVYRARRGARAR
jgi:diaminohydroxyphosphoribosylaminopyrimidine deaminase/5-amino-6-(5-phosphoribosylamino)uracil reductase